MENSACYGNEALLTPTRAEVCETIFRYYEWDHGSTLTKTAPAAKNGTVTWFEDEETDQDDQPYIVPEFLEALIGKGLLDGSSKESLTLNDRASLHARS